MGHLRAVVAAALLVAASCHRVAAEEPVKPPAAAATTQPLPTGRVINPAAVASQNVGSLPVNLVASADGRFAICTDGGYRQALYSIRLEDGEARSHVNVPKPAGLYYGLAVAAGTVYCAQGGWDAIAVAAIAADGKLKPDRTISTKKGDFPAGLALDAGGRLYVANNDPVAHPAEFRPSSVAVYDTKADKEIGRFEFADSFGGTPNFPLAIAVTKDGRACYVASQRDSAVYVLDTSDVANIKQAAKIETGSHPVALVFSADQKRLFVANAHSDTVSFVDTGTNAVTKTILLRPDVARSLAGATPTGLALDARGKFLYATLGDMNAVAVIDVPDAELEGYIPAGWYPTAVVVDDARNRLLIANAKGVKPRNPNPKVVDGDPKKKTSPNNLLEGNVITVAIPSKEELKKQTVAVLEYNRLTANYLDRPNPLQAISREAGKIKHVIYIVKENRTYDHVLGDVKEGNGDARYCLFGKDVTPNQHALAARFVLMDNFYDSGEVSGDGWTWSTQAMANEYTIRNVPYQYSDRGRRFDYEGTNNDLLSGGFPAIGPDGKPMSDHPRFREGQKAFPDVAEAPGGHLWDLARKHGLTVRNYGFFMSNGVKKDKVQVIPDNYPASAGLQPGGHDLEGVTDVDFRKFDVEYADSEAWKVYHDRDKAPNAEWIKTKFGKYDAPSRFSEWNREFRQMLKKDPGGGAVPNLMLVRLCTDHTAGANPGKKSPRAMVADNDYAVGQLVEAVSTSAIWKETAIFIIEDDAQDGPDHVDAHRSTCYVISPWHKRGVVDHGFHNTSSCLRTIELLLNLPPMCQYDGIAAPLGDWDTAPNNAEPHAAILPAKEIITDTNPKKGEVKPTSPEARLMEESERMDFTVADRAPADKLNEVIWKLTRGVDAKVPVTPKGIAGVTVPKVKDDDDD